MLDRATHQAAGLLEFASPPAPKLIAMVSHGDEQSELPLLWRLCSSLVDFGYSVTVLDATVCETDNNPGLEQLLEYAYWRGNESFDTVAWTVIPAALGLHGLAAQSDRREQSLKHLGRLFLNEGIVVVYGKADWLAPLLSGTGVQPLLAVAGAKNSLLTSYQALKRLLLKGRLQPTIVNMVRKQHGTEFTQMGAVVSNLSDCARNFLGFEVHALRITLPENDDQSCPDIQGLALRVLESALPLPVNLHEVDQYIQQPDVLHYAGSH